MTRRNSSRLKYRPLVRSNMARTMPSQRAWKTGSLRSAITGPNPCIPPMSCTPFTFTIMGKPTPPIAYSRVDAAPASLERQAGFAGTHGAKHREPGTRTEGRASFGFEYSLGRASNRNGTEDVCSAADTAHSHIDGAKGGKTPSAFKQPERRRGAGRPRRATTRPVGWATVGRGL